MRLEQLQYLVQVVERHSFNKAALQLSITQPALTAAMNALESELGVKLFVRSYKGAFPTSYGMQIYEECKNIIAELETKMLKWALLKEQPDEKHPCVHVVAIPSACNYLVDTIIVRLQAEFGINVTLHEEILVHIADFLQSGKARIGITSILNQNKEAELAKYKALQYQAHFLLDDEYAVFISTKNPLAKKKALTVDDCAALHFATYATERNYQESIFQAATKLFQLNRIYYLNSRESIMQMIARNKAVGFFLHKMAANNWYVKNGLICAKPVRNMHLLPSEHYLLWLENEQAMSQAERTVAGFIRDNYLQPVV